MKNKIKLILIYGAVLLLGASLAAGLFYAYGFPVSDNLSDDVGGALSFSDFLLLTCRFLKPLLLIFLSGFTIYACAVGGLCCFGLGLTMGQLVMRYGLSGLNPFTHAAGLVFYLAFSSLFALLSAEAALLRSTLKAVAPEPRELLRRPESASFLYSFLLAAGAATAFSAALYFFLYYFPLP